MNDFNLTKEQKEAAQGLGAIGWVVFIVFLILKLTGVITWSWWWVTIPIWGVPALFIAIGLIAIVIGTILGIIFSVFGG